MNKTLAIAAACIALPLCSLPLDAAQTTGNGDGGLQYRITVGLTDTGEKDWTGRITVTGGTIAALKGYRFSGDDQASNSGSFHFMTKVGVFENQLRGQTDWNDPNLRRLVPQGVILRVRGVPATKVKFETRFVSFEFSASQVTYTHPIAALNGNALVEQLPAEELLSEAGTASDSPAIAIGPNGERWTAWLAYQDSGDTVSVSDGGLPSRLTEKGDHQGPAITVAPNGWVHVAWAEREGAEFHIHTTIRALGRWTRSQRISTPGSSNISPVLVSDDKGRIALVWQSLHEGRSSIRMKFFDGRNWGHEIPVNEDKANAWTPSAAFGGGKLWIAWDSYATGSYQIYAREYGTERVHRVTAGDLFSVRPSIAVSAGGVPVVAWEESDTGWGKDFAYLVDKRGTVLYKNRRVRLAYLDNDGWKEPAGPIADTVSEDIRRYIQQPKLMFDAAGRLYLAFRCRTSAQTTRMDYWATGGRWETFLTSLDGGQWTHATPLPSSVGRNGMNAAIAAGKDTIHAIWPTDNRIWPQVKYGELEIYATRMPATANAPALRDGKLISSSQTLAAPIHPNENADVARIRNYRIGVGGKTYRILRGDLHRHTELSSDGAGDGQLEDLYRYALDAAQMDYAHVADHQMGNDEAYNWWLTQKSNDLYFMPERFVPLYGYERSVRYPNGHRNIIWAQRGQPVLRIAPAEQQGQVNTGSLLYPYLKRTDGIATSHTSATEQGTDWRDNDPSLEPFAEIYQGYESSYEHEGAPRAWKEGEKSMHQGQQKAGYIWNAWAKGYKLGVQSSSDHVSTHTSFACILAEEFSRKGLVDAMRKRHTYAATDAIVLDFRVGGVGIMGDSVRVTGPPRLQVKAIGTAPIRQIDVIKNNTYILKATPNQQESSFEFADMSAHEESNYYYIRVEQVDGQLAWSSPIWVTLNRNQP